MHEKTNEWVVEPMKGRKENMWQMLNYGLIYAPMAAPSTTKPESTFDKSVREGIFFLPEKGGQKNQFHLL